MVEVFDKGFVDHYLSLMSLTLIYTKEKKVLKEIDAVLSRKMALKTSNQAFHEMARNTDRHNSGDGSIVVLSCEYCTEKEGKIAKRFGTVKYVLYIPDIDGPSHLGIWRCDVCCLDCNGLNRDICFYERRPRESVKTPPTVTEWKAADWTPRSEDEK